MTKILKRFSEDRKVFLIFWDDSGDVLHYEEFNSVTEAASFIKDKHIIDYYNWTSVPSEQKLNEVLNLLKQNDKNFEEMSEKEYNDWYEKFLSMLEKDRGIQSLTAKIEEEISHPKSDRSARPADNKTDDIESKSKFLSDLFRAKLTGKDFVLGCKDYGIDKFSSVMQMLKDLANEDPEATIAGRPAKSLYRDSQFTEKLQENFEWMKQEFDGTHIPDNEERTAPSKSQEVYICEVKYEERRTGYTRVQTFKGNSAQEVKEDAQDWICDHQHFISGCVDYDVKRIK